MTKSYDFDEKIEEGYNAEKKVKDNFKAFMKPIADSYFSNKCYKYGLTGHQINGIDGKGEFNFQYDVKVNRYYPKKSRIILLESRHEGINFYYKGQDTMRNGWIWYSESDIIFWLWWAKNGKNKCFCDGYYLFLDNIREWLRSLQSDTLKEKEKKNNGYSKNNRNKWWTWNYYFKPKEIPKNCILQIKEMIFKIDIKESYFNRWFNFPKNKKHKKKKKKMNENKTNYTLDDY